ncbi:MAG: protein kinase [Candidatus Aminicenantes bacterium]|nr:protein kinase [Candidatus Aminicenantes bacterium]
MILSIHKKCPNCGFENPEAAKFCNECGSKLSPPETVTSVESGEAAAAAASPPPELAVTPSKPLGMESEPVSSSARITPPPMILLEIPDSSHLLPPSPASLAIGKTAAATEVSLSPPPTTPPEPASPGPEADIAPEDVSVEVKKPDPPFGERFRIIEELGEGGLGTVYKVFDKAMERELALKSIKPEIIENRDVFEGFSREMKIERGIVHKNVARVFELNALPQTPFITMEYVPGCDLKSMIKGKKGLPVMEAFAIARQIFSGLAEVHRKGTLHLDLRSDNILIDKEGTAKIMDLGIARLFRSKGITRGVAGMPQYMSPEQMEGREADAGSDIYAAGVVLYEMLTGSLPPVGQPPRAPRELNPGIPNNLSLLVLKCLESDKETRYKTVAAVLEELERMEDEIRQAAVEAPAAPPAVKPAVFVPDEEPPPPAPQATSEVLARPKKTAQRKWAGTGFAIPRKYLFTALFALAAVILVVFLWRVVFTSSEGPAPGAPKPARISLAVLPLEDLEPDGSHEHLGDVTAEALTRALKKMSRLHVLDEESSFSLKGARRDGRSIGRQLQVDRYLDGGLLVQGKNLHVEVRLVGTDSGAVLWSDQYDRTEEQLPSVIEEIGRAVAEKLEPARPPEQAPASGDAAPLNFEAFNAYAQGRWLARKGGAENLEKALEHFDNATAKEPRFALAFAGLADTFIRLADGRHWPPDRAYPKAKAAALKALLIDQRLAEAHVAVAKVKMVYEWDFAGAEKGLREALRLDPDCAPAHQSLAALLSAQGRNSEAIHQIRAAQSLNPRSSPLKAKVGEILYFARLYEEADAEIKKALATDPLYPGHHHNAGLLQIHRDRYEDAILSLRRAAELGADPEETDLLLAHIYARQGRRADVGRILTAALQSAKKNGVQQVSIASVYAGLNDREQVIACLEISHRKREPGLLLLKVNPMFDLVRADPRFIGLLQKIGLGN